MELITTKIIYGTIKLPFQGAPVSASQIPGRCHRAEINQAFSLQNQNPS